MKISNGDDKSSQLIRLCNFFARRREVRVPAELSRAWRIDDEAQAVLWGYRGCDVSSGASQAQERNCCAVSTCRRSPHPESSPVAAATPGSIRPLFPPVPPPEWQSVRRAFCSHERIHKSLQVAQRRFPFGRGPLRFKRQLILPMSQRNLPSARGRASTDDRYHSLATRSMSSSM